MKDKINMSMGSIIIICTILLVCLIFVPLLDVNCYDKSYTFIKRSKVSVFQIIKSKPKVNVNIEAHVD